MYHDTIAIVRKVEMYGYHYFLCKDQLCYGCS